MRYRASDYNRSQKGRTKKNRNIRRLSVASLIYLIIARKSPTLRSFLRFDSRFFGDGLRRFLSMCLFLVRSSIYMDSLRAGTHQSSDHGVKHQGDQQAHVTGDRFDFSHRFLFYEAFSVLLVCCRAEFIGQIALVAVRHLHERRKPTGRSRNTDSACSAMRSSNGESFCIF